VERKGRSTHIHMLTEPVQLVGCVGLGEEAEGTHQVGCVVFEGAGDVEVCLRIKHYQQLIPEGGLEIGRLIEASRKCG